MVAIRLASPVEASIIAVAPRCNAHGDPRNPTVRPQPACAVESDGGDSASAAPRPAEALSYAAFAKALQPGGASDTGE